MGVFASVESSAFELRESAQQVDGLAMLESEKVHDRSLRLRSVGFMRLGREEPT